MRDLVFLTAFLAMLPPALRFGHVGTMVWAWVSMISPNHYLYGFARTLPLNKIVVAVAAVSLFLDRENRAKFYTDAHMKLMYAFLFIGMVSYMFALSDRPRVHDLADRLFKVVILCTFMVMVLRERLQIHSLLVAVCMGMSIHGAIEAAKFIASRGGHVMQGPATIGDNNHFGLAVLMVIPPLIYLYRWTVSPLVRTVLGLAIAANVAGVIATNSRGALLGMLVMGFAMFLKSRNKLRTVIVLVVLAGVGLAIAPERWYGRMSTISSAESDGSFMGRVASWKMNALVAIDRPLVGGGFSAMEDGLIWSSYLSKLPMLDFLPTPPPNQPLAAHSIYFQVLGDTGFVGFILFCSVLAVAFRNCRVIVRLTANRPDLAWAADVGHYMRFSLIAYAVSGAALSMAYFEFYWALATLISITKHHIEGLVEAPIGAGAALLQAAELRPRTTLPGRPIPGQPIPPRPGIPERPGRPALPANRPGLGSLPRPTR